jgi:ABC-2 type transport system permease protein
MRLVILRIKAFFLRDLFNHASYPLNFFVSIILSPLVVSFVLFFVSSEVIGPTNIKDINMDYFFYSIVGISLAELSIRIGSALNSEVRNYQLTGIFEEIVNLRVPVIEVLFYSFTYPIMMSLTRVIILFSYSYIFFNLELSLINLGLILISYFFVVGSFIGIGFIGGAYCIAFKKGNPITTINSYSTMILGGVLLPTYLLPDFLINFASILPVYHAAELIRGLFLNGTETTFLNINLLYLCILSTFYLLIGILLCNKSLKYAKKNGTLLFY